MSIERAKRQYQSFPGSQYILPSDIIERDRLALQHRVLKQALENQLIRPPVSLNAGDRILDSGTGSGTWLLDIIEMVSPDVILICIDIEPRLFPTTCPQVISRGKVDFSVCSITKLPADWSESFAFINQRLLIAALRTEEWKEAFEEMHRTLLPGGWVQLGEIGTLKCGPVTEKYQSLLRALFSFRGLDLDCVMHIPLLLKDTGFTNISVKKHSIPLGRWAGEMGIEARDNFIGAYVGMKDAILSAGGFGFVKTEVELDALHLALEKEWDETEGSIIEYVVFCAQKCTL
ncbi:uncharacterized protein FIBRA_06823 [Fibroporia radiculosa]|uniref:Methyltransferase domain-containing protein n=1 Tax=Fibroporia radiculosa TaxID=599839 RepID=J4H4A2_9APHY|nr:uncharacterized protein FIBRA_06823 [Fibroporia radiculosa]CCM04639.1 predicted protein [Fibroporia radiculosa]